MKAGAANVISISGGKDSTATALHAVEQSAPNLRFVFADTGHEHAATYEYVDYLDGVLRERCGTGVTIVRADFSAEIARKREIVQTKWREDGIPAAQIERALAVLHPTGIPMLDLCLARGRFPSTRARFCSQELKHFPIERQVLMPLLADHRAVISWQGVRADESQARRDLPARDGVIGGWDPEPHGLLIYRPILTWTAADVFAFHRRHGVRWNPLYEHGMGRVGCMPCIHATKAEIKEIAARFPEELGRLKEWEQLVRMASKRGAATFFAADKTPGEGDTRSDIESVVQWARTSRGGRQYDLLVTDDAAPGCSSIYGLCE